MRTHLHFLTTHSFCNQRQPTSFSYNSSEITLSKINIPPPNQQMQWPFLGPNLIPLPAAILTVTISHSSITPIKYLLPLYHHNYSPIRFHHSHLLQLVQEITGLLDASPIDSSPSPLSPAVGRKLPSAMGKRNEAYPLHKHRHLQDACYVLGQVLTLPLHHIQ